METSYELKVVGVAVETPDAHSVSFAVPEGAEAAFSYKPGQFLTLGVPSDQTGVVARSYSLSSSHDGGPLTVTVKRTAAGYPLTGSATTSRRARRSVRFRRRAASSLMISASTCFC
jgi:ferredoxin-NADP reductase